jgi:hypothetical protein
MVISRTDEWTARDAVLPMAGQVSRGEFFAALLILGCANGLGSRVIESINQLGWADALANTFDISVIVWISCIAGVSIVLRDRSGEVRWADLAIGAGFLFLVILPIGSLSWLAVTALCLYALVCTEVLSSRPGFVILLATTVPALWTPLLFRFFANPILEADASLVGWLLGTHRTGTMVEFADSSGYLAIFPRCSSLANISLAFLCWVTVSRFMRHKRSAFDLLWCLLACASGVAVNVARMSMMGLNHSFYDAIHSDWGDAVVNVIILGLTLGVSALGVRRELFSHA